MFFFGDAGEGVFHEIRVYEGSYDDHVFRAYRLEPALTVDAVIEIFLTEKNIAISDEGIMDEYCLLEADIAYGEILSLA